MDWFDEGPDENYWLYYFPSHRPRRVRLSTGFKFSLESPPVDTLEKRLAAMTVNERLSELGLFESWDAVVTAQGRVGTKKILH